MANETRVEGLGELQAILEALPRNLQKNAMRRTLNRGAGVIREAARQLVPVKTGALLKSIRVSTGTLRNGQTYARIRAGGGKAFYAHMVEFGTAAHKITAKDGALLIAGGHPVTEVEHPGAAPFPFMRFAVDMAASEAVDTVADALGDEVVKEVHSMMSGMAKFYAG